jgi:low temperature requirement protein LtrA
VAGNDQARARRLLRAEGTEARVSPLELFFDLVFVFALTKVTSGMAEDPTFTGLLHGMLVLVPLYWAWSGYAWLTSTVDPELVLTRMVMFAAMAGMGLAAVATPGAFGDDTLAWGIGYLVVRLVHVALFALAARGNPDLLRQVMSLVRALVPVAGLVLTAGLAFDGTVRDLLWLAAILLDVGLVLVAGVEGWVVHAEHFSERFGLVLIIALGESVVAIGAGTFDLGVEEAVAGTIAIVTICMLWWAYFDVYALVAERSFHEAVGAEQLRIARDSYALLHLPMIAGIVLFALGVKKVLEHTGDPMKDMPAVALCGGLALYAVSQVAFRWRNTGTFSAARTVTGLACMAVIPLAMQTAALVALAVLALVWITLITFETIMFAAYRQEVRGAQAHVDPS